MDNIQEAIKILKDNIYNCNASGDFSYIGSAIDKVITFLESEPEPTELAEKVRTITETAIQEGRSTGYILDEDEWYEIKKLCNEIDRQANHIKILKQCDDSSTEVISKLDVKNKELQAAIKAQDEEIERLGIDKYRLIVPSYMEGMLERGEIPKGDLDEWYKQTLKNKTI